MNKPFIFALALAACLVPGLALAHAHLKDQTASSQEIRLSFSEGIETAFSEVTLTDTNGTAVGTLPLATVVDDKRVLIVKPKAPLAAGDYHVKWHVLSVDTHKSSGIFDFKIEP